MWAMAVAAFVVVLLVVGILTGALRQHRGERLAQLGLGESIETSLARIDVQSVRGTAEDLTVTVTVMATTDHPVGIREVFAFRVDGEEERSFDAEAGDAEIEHLNPRVPVEIALSYSPREGEDEIALLVLDGEWQTQNENALALPDHAVLLRPVAVVVE